MHETPEDLAQLQDLLDRSYAAAGQHLLNNFSEQSRLTATELVETLDGIFEIHIAVINAEGAPIVAPVDAVIFRGKIWFGFPPGAYRNKLLRQDDRVSASYTRGESFLLLAHGTARQVLADEPVFEPYYAYIRELYVKAYGPGWIKWHEQNRGEPGAEYNAWLEPRRIYAKR
ncbi:MAG: hypothetical protein AAF512_10495 [Pseudomonadota bacterium]